MPLIRLEAIAFGLEAIASSLVVGWRPFTCDFKQPMSLSSLLLHLFASRPSSSSHPLFLSFLPGVLTVAAVLFCSRFLAFVNLFNPLTVLLRFPCKNYLISLFHSLSLLLAFLFNTFNAVFLLFCPCSICFPVSHFPSPLPLFLFLALLTFLQLVLHVCFSLLESQQSFRSVPFVVFFEMHFLNSTNGLQTNRPFSIQMFSGNSILHFSLSSFSFCICFSLSLSVMLFTMSPSMPCFLLGPLFGLLCL